MYINQCIKSLLRKNEMKFEVCRKIELQKKKKSPEQGILDRNYKYDMYSFLCEY